MKFILLALVAIALSYEVEWQEFKSKFNKVYYSAEEHNGRFKVFRDNLDFIKSHNAEKAGFSVGMNHFGDLTNFEFTALLNGMNVTKKPSQHNSPIINVNAPTSWDWRTKGAVTGIKNQGQCGSCWSFSATGSMEGVHFIKTGQLVSLSEQNLVDCSVPQGNNGCGGGLMDNAFQYVITNNGIDTEASYPYTATGPNPCRFNPANVGAKISNYHDVSPSGSETSLLNAVYLNPTSVAIDASHSSFQFYNGGVYYEPACSSQSLDHGVLAVGYGTYQGFAFWQVKNSWGTGWGMNGYIMMSRNRNNNCGIATMASYPIA